MHSRDAPKIADRAQEEPRTTRAQAEPSSCLDSQTVRLSGCRHTETDPMCCPVVYAQLSKYLCKACQPSTQPCTARPSLHPSAPSDARAGLPHQRVQPLTATPLITAPATHNRTTTATTVQSDTALPRTHRWQMPRFGLSPATCPPTCQCIGPRRLGLMRSLIAWKGGHADRTRKLRHSLTT